MRNALRPLLVFLIPTLLIIPESVLPVTSPTYRVRNRELGIVYQITDWDQRQWDAVFSDPAPPMSWAILPVGSGGCKAIVPSLLREAGQANFRLGLLIDPFVSKKDIQETIDCAVPYGVKRIILDEYASYQSKNLSRPICTVLAEIREIYQYAKSKYPNLEMGIDDNWQTWVGELGPFQNTSCGPYPHFKYDIAGVSVLSKYDNPVNGSCGRPTTAEMREQLLDLRGIVIDYSRSRRIFVWQLNQHWYPGEGDVLQFFRQVKVAYGWRRFFLFGPTADDKQTGNWGYDSSAERTGCFPSGYQWYLPARNYLIRISEGLKTSIRFQLPTSSTTGSNVTVDGTIRAARQGIGVSGIQLQEIPPVASTQSFHKDMIAPPGARVAVVGARVNIEIPYKVKGPAQFSLDRAQMFETGSTRNLVANSDFNDGFNNWLLLKTGSVGIATNGLEKSVLGTCSSDQFISLTSFPILVNAGHSYTVNFDAAIFQEARNNAYFFVLWSNGGDIQRDRFYMTFPNRTTVASTSSRADGSFRFNWQPVKPGVHTLVVFFPGTRNYRPSLTSYPIIIN